MKWLVTGGAGYIGSHVVSAFLDADIEPVVLDDLSSGYEEFVPRDVEFIRGSVLDIRALESALSGVSGVVHLAGYKYAGESVRYPLHTYEQNVVGTMRLLSAMAELEIERLVFSSSAAVYGTPHVEKVDESTPTVPESPYGETKLIGEWLIQDQASTMPLRHTSLRYFNVVGSAKPELRDSSPHNLFPRLFRALERGDAPHVNGTDYDTPDGSCVRDYVHVDDVARAHVAAAKALNANRSLKPVYNLGAGVGTSVLKIMATAAKVTGIEFTPELRGRRAGDPAVIVASGLQAEADLEWRNSHTIDSMVETAWRAWLHARD